MTGQTSDVAVELYPLLINHFAYVMSAVARSAGPSRCGLPQEPVKAVPSALNFGSPKPPVDRLPEGLLTV
jgi:hypothetical protein